MENVLIFMQIALLTKKDLKFVIIFLFLIVKKIVISCTRDSIFQIEFGTESKFVKNLHLL